MADEEQPSAPPLSVVIKPTAGGDKFTVTVPASASVADLKAQVALGGPNIPAEEQRLIYKGQVLKDERALSDYGYQNEHVVHLVRGRSAAAASPAPAAATTTPSAPQPASSWGGTGTANPMDFSGGFPGTGGFPMGGFPNDPQQMSDMVRQMRSNPMVQVMLNNPQLLREMLQNNPAIRQVMDANPQVAQMLSDPAMLREAMEVASNPELLREQMRTADRAMSNVEAHPEGYNMLRRMYESVQEPLANAANDNPFSALSQPTNTASTAPPPPPDAAQPLPNPWAPTAGGGTTAAAGNPLGAANPLAGLGAAPTPELMQSMLSDPSFRAMSESLLSSPGYLEAMMEANPQMRGIMEANPQMREMMRNPELIRSMLSPENMQAMMQMQQAMQTLGNSPMGAAMGLPTGGGGGGNLLAGLGGLGGGFAAPPPPADPATAYAAQLAQLQDMGFYDAQENLRALIATQGNVNAAVERLLAFNASALG